MAKRKSLQELTIVDDFMFGAVMQEPKRCKILLEMVLGVKIKKIIYPQLQKTIDKLYDSKSIRLDVYVEDGKGTVYNVEMQTTMVKSLPKRMRYYQGLIDLNILDKGKNYDALKKSFVIFFCTYDPFGEGRYVYTFENRCLQNLKLAFGDEATKIVLNTKGTVGEISEDLKSLLHFMDGMEPESKYARELESAVESIKKSEEWRREYMVMIERDWDNRNIGKWANKVSIVRRKRGDYPIDVLADITDTKPEDIYTMMDLIDKHPDWEDDEIADDILFC